MDNLGSSQSMTDRGMRVALIFALAAERLTTYYEHQQWLILVLPCWILLPGKFHQGGHLLSY